MPTRYHDWREARRFRAFELHEQAWRVTDIAQALGVTKGAVSQWLKRAREEGPEALRAQPHVLRRKPRLSDEDKARLPALLDQGPEAFGFRGAVWTRRRVSELIRREFGVRYSVWQTGRILRRLGYSPQQPVVRATQRDEAAIAAWHAERLPAIKKKGG